MITITPATRRAVTVAAPPSKAHTLRALFLASLADGTSVIRNPLLGEDQQRAIDCLAALGAHLSIDGDVVTVRGVGGTFKPLRDELHVGESGVTMNFLAAAACLCDAPVTITGAPRILQRPIAEVVSGMRQLGCRLDYLGDDGFPPIRVHGGGIPGGLAEISGRISSQYFSAICAAAPYAGRPVTLRCTDRMSEKPYLGITLSVMAAFGVPTENDAFAEMRVPSGRGYGARDFTVEGDYSSASFFFEAAAVCRAAVTVTGLEPDSVQGDRRALDLFRQMGCTIEGEAGGLSVRGAPLRAIRADMSDTPDLVPPVAVAAAFADGATRLGGIGHLRHKECDRLAVIAGELARMGIDAHCDDSSLTVVGGQPHGAVIDPHNDHRIAMSFGVAGLATEGQSVGNETCVAKSFPDFWDRLRAFH
jgi:3-phosphoshikimate 1-carboxyvinyltransferase